MSSAVTTISDDQFSAEVLEADRPVVVDFWAAWCPPCRVMEPVLAELAAERPDVRVVKLDVDANQRTRAQYGVLSMPTLLAEADVQSRALQVDGLANCRDLGGLRRLDGTLTPRRAFYRSENIDRVTAAGWEQIRIAGIRTVVDLRQPSERELDVSARPQWLTTAAVDLDRLEDEGAGRRGVVSLHGRARPNRDDRDDAAHRG